MQAAPRQIVCTGASPDGMRNKVQERSFCTPTQMLVCVCGRGEVVCVRQTCGYKWDRRAQHDDVSSVDASEMLGGGLWCCVACCVICKGECLAACSRAYGDGKHRKLEDGALVERKAPRCTAEVVVFAGMEDDFVDVLA